MANVQDVARFFIDLAQKQYDNNQGDLATNMRVQKLLYFAQGAHLAQYGKPLFDAPIQAWPYGPVVPEVYNRYSRYGAQGIVSDDVDSSIFTPEEFDTLLNVAFEYDCFSTSALMRMTHEPGTPWSQTERKSEIPLEKIKTYFAAQPRIQPIDNVLAACPVPVVEPKRDANGVAMLPADWDDDWGDE